MQAHLEPRRPSPPEQSFVFFDRVDQEFAFDWHYHPELELTLIESGSGTRFVGDSIEPYGPGDLVLLGPSLPHTWSSDTSSAWGGSQRARVLLFGADLIPPELRKLPEFSTIAQLLTRAARGVVVSAERVAMIAPRLRALAAKRGLTAWQEIVAVLELAANDVGARALSSAAYEPLVDQVAQRRVERVLAFVAERAHESLSLSDVARTIHFSRSAFCRFFRRTTGQTFIAYVHALRVGRACQMLIDTDRSVAEVAYACGFNNLASFNRQFKRLKRLAPTEFRSRHGRAGKRAEAGKRKLEL